MENVVKYKGKSFKVIDRRTKAQYVCEGQDEGGNPKTRFVSTQMLTPSELEKREAELNKEYDKVDMTFAHEITTLFREVINKGDDSKDVQVVNAQRQFKKGKWSDVDPIKEMQDLGELPNSSTSASFNKAKEWSKGKLLTLWAVIIVGIVFIITQVVKYVKMRGAQ